jgi:tRNA (guanine-N7-)-methyltransferase
MPRPPLKIEAPDLRLDPDRILEPEFAAEIFGGDRPVEIEIGIGKGRFLLAAATARPQVLHVGIEWANQFLRIAESRAQKYGLTNVRFARVDALDLLQQSIPSASITAYYVFYPDPWPKARHHKRRFLQSSTALHIARTLVEGGTLHVCTDHADYWEWIDDVFRDHAAFDRLPEFGGDAFPLPVDEPLTNFEDKYLVEGRERYRASWRRNALAVDAPLVAPQRFRAEKRARSRHD